MFTITIATTVAITITTVMFTGVRLGITTTIKDLRSSTTKDLRSSTTTITTTTTIEDLRTPSAGRRLRETTWAIGRRHQDGTGIRDRMNHGGGNGKAVP